tara:strand:- start:666 stop:773 length:108 start_codon:yes stop_codon:yes gene_type:complete
MQKIRSTARYQLAEKGITFDLKSYFAPTENVTAHC